LSQSQLNPPKVTREPEKNHQKGGVRQNFGAMHFLPRITRIDRIFKPIRENFRGIRGKDFLASQKTDAHPQKGIISPRWDGRGKIASRLRDQVCQRWDHFSSGHPVM